MPSLITSRGRPIFRAAYKSLLLDDYGIPYFAYGTALLNALIVAKVILIGEYAHLGKRHENKPLLVSSLYKAILFSALMFGWLNTSFINRVSQAPFTKFALTTCLPAP